MKPSSLRFILFLVIISLIFILFCYIQPVEGKEMSKIIHVDDDNAKGPWDGTSEHPYQNITIALHQALSKETIFVHNGFYNENLNITKSITLLGENNSATIINARNGHNAITITSDSVTIHNFTIQNTTVGRHKCLKINSDDNHISHNNFYNEKDNIDIINSKNTIIEHNTLYKMDGTKWFAESGIHLRDSANCVISHNVFANLYSFSIFLYNCSETLIQENTLNVCGGIRLSYSEHNVIINNSLASTFWFGIRLHGNNNTIRNNVFRGSTLVLDDCFNQVIENNTINDNPIVYLKEAKNLHIKNAGQVILYRCQNISISHLARKENYIGRQANIGIDIMESKNCLISDCNITDMDEYGIRIFRSTNLTISDNTICITTKVREYFDYIMDIGLLIRDSNDVNIVDNNISYNEHYGIKISDCSNVNISNNIISQNTGIGLSVIRSAKNHLISENIIQKNYIGIKIQSGTEGLTIIKNTISANYDFGLDISGSSHVLIIENIITNNNKTGIHFYHAHNNDFLNNTIRKNNLTGIYSEECVENNIRGNSISHQLLAIYLYGSNNTFSGNKIQSNICGIIVSGENNKLSNNILKHTLFKSMMLNAEHTVWEHNYWNRPRLLPKIIFGLYIEYGHWHDPLPEEIKFVFGLDSDPSASPNGMDKNT